MGWREADHFLSSYEAFSHKDMLSEQLVFGISDYFLLISCEAMRLAPEELGNLLKHEVLFIDKLRT